MDTLARSIEVVFTAYMVPALMVPVVWIACRVARAVSGRQATPGRGSLARVQGFYASLAGIWIATWLACSLGVPLGYSGRAGLLLSWLAYAALNVSFAVLLVRFTAGYGALEDGREKDRLFLRFVGLFLVQPVTTACAFMVLYRVMGVDYRLQVPELPPIQIGF